MLNDCQLHNKICINTAYCIIPDGYVINQVSVGCSVLGFSNKAVFSIVTNRAFPVTSIIVRKKVNLQLQCPQRSIMALWGWPCIKKGNLKLKVQITYHKMKEKINTTSYDVPKLYVGFIKIIVSKGTTHFKI